MRSVQARHSSSHELKILLRLKLSPKRTSVKIHETTQRRDEPMNPSAVSVASQIPHWASRQLDDYDARAHPGTMFAEGVVLDVGQGYELQAAGPAAP